MFSEFFSPHARSPVVRTIAVLIVSLLIGCAGILLLRNSSLAIVAATGGVLTATATKFCIELVRRRHDRGADGRIVVVALPAFAVAFLGYVTFILPPTIFYLVAILAAAGLAWVIFAPSEPGENAYGPRATRPFVPSTIRASRTALIVGLALTLGGGAASFGGAAWLDAIKRRQAENERWSQQQSFDIDNSTELQPANR